MSRMQSGALYRAPLQIAWGVRPMQGSMAMLHARATMGSRGGAGVLLEATALGAGRGPARRMGWASEASS